MRQQPSNASGEDFEIPGLKRQQIVEFRLDSWESAQDIIRTFALLKVEVKTLHISALGCGYRVKSALEGVHASELRALLTDETRISGVCIETLFSSESAN